MIATIWAFIGSPLGGRVGAGVSLALALLCVGQCTALNASKAEAARLSEAINAPVTGWSARLAACQAGKITLETALSDQGAKVQAFAGEMDRLKADHDKALTGALKGKAKAERSAADLQALAKTFGTNACADLETADAAILKGLAR